MNTNFDTTSMPNPHKRVYSAETVETSLPKRQRIDPEQVETVGTILGRKAQAIQTTCSSGGTYFPNVTTDLVMSYVFNQEQFNSLFMITQDPTYGSNNDENAVSSRDTTDRRNALFARALTDFVAPQLFSSDVTLSAHNYKVLLATAGEPLRGLTDELVANNTLPCSIVSQRQDSLHRVILPLRMLREGEIGARSLHDWAERATHRQIPSFALGRPFPPVTICSLIAVMPNKTHGEVYPLVSRTVGQKAYFTYFNDNSDCFGPQSFIPHRESTGYHPVQGAWDGRRQRGGFQIRVEGEQETSSSSSSSSSSSQPPSSPQIQERVLNHLTLDLGEGKPSREFKLPTQLVVTNGELLEIRILAIKECSQIESEVELYHLVEAVQNRVEAILQQK